MKKIYLPNGMFRQCRARYLFFALFFSFLLQQKASAQNPNLPAKTTLGQTLLSNRSFTNPSAVDTAMRSIADPDGYSLEVVARVRSATGRGLDIEGRNRAFNGFRLSLDATTLKTTNPLTSSQVVSATTAGTNQVIRVAVRNDSAYFYQNGYFLMGQPLAAVKDIVNGTESTGVSGMVSGPNLVASWANGSGTPGSNGWAVDGSTTHSIFNMANSGSGVRYLDFAAPGGAFTNPDGSKFIGRLMYIRWDNDAILNSVYSLPVTLEANTTYDFSWLSAYVSNASTNTRTMTVGIGKTMTLAGRTAFNTYTTNGTQAFKRENLTFTSQEAGVYYLTFNGIRALFAISELAIRKIDIEPRFVLGKNYPTGATDMEIVSATYEAGAWAPAAPASESRQTVTLSGASVWLPTTFNTNFVVPGKTDVHFTAENTPYANSSIALNSNDAWLFFDNIRPSTVLSDWLPTITINGAAAVNNTNFRLSVYKNGTVIIPNGNLTNNAPLEVFTQPDGGGTAQVYPINTVHNNLGTFNNAIRSFKLKRGYAATFANNTDGTGYSRVFVANDSDIVVNAMPQGLDATASFVRVVKWNWPSKKGKAGWSPAKIGATWYYDWNIAGDASNPNYEYQSIRQTQYWPGFGDIVNKGVSQILGFNEPDRPDQANMTVDQCVAAWPGLMQTGLRVGSPAPANPESNYITDFLRKTDSLNYRVDFVAIHCYWGGATPQQWYSRLLNIYNRVKRPLWITEWNNGANWTTESWPSDVPSQLQKQLADMKGILQVLDTASFIERYAEYDWVENKRALVLADTLTPAGKYYFANKSDFSYNASKAFVHNWKLAAPRLYSAIQDTNYFRVRLNWNDANGELGSQYVLERKIEGRDADFVAVQTYTGYAANAGMNFMDSVYAKATYRLKAVGTDVSLMTYSTALDVVGDAAPTAPVNLTDSIISSTRAQIRWNLVDIARSYNLKRSMSANGPWTTLAARTSASAFTDTTLAPATTYYYVVTTLNSAGESANSGVLSITTPALVIPTSVINPRIASGDGKVVITWDFQYDVRYKLVRMAGNTADTIATNINALRFVDYNRVNNTTYAYKVVAYNEKGSSPATTMLMATPRAGQHVYVGFEDTSSVLAADAWGGYHAALQAGATRDAGYAANTRALKLDGSATSFAQLGTGAVDSLNQFTIATWVKMTSLSNWMRLFDFGTGTNKYMFLTPQVSATGGVSTVRYVIKNGGAEQILNYGYTWSLNTWTHLAVTQSADSVKLFINGVQVAATNGITIRPADLGITNLNYIGKSQFSADPNLNGLVDEFKIYNRALSAENIVNLYAGTPLPITLSSFAGKPVPQGNLLTWQVSTTSNSIRMELEKSTDGRNFSTAYAISATRTTAALPFSFTDVQAKGSINYYRLKMIDADGKLTYSSVIAITSHVKGLTLVGLYPSVVQNSTLLSISATAATAVKTVIADANGRLVQTATHSLVAGSNLLNINASGLAAGIYTITVYEAANRLGNIRFVVNR